MQPTQEQLIAYFSGKASDTEVLKVEDWLRTGQDNGQVEESIRVVMEAMTDPFSETDRLSEIAKPPLRTLLAHERFLDRISVDKHQSKVSVTVYILRHVVKYVAGLAAAFLLGLAGTGVYRHYKATSAYDGVAVTSHDSIFHGSKAAITRITLTDNSVVCLFPGSALTVSGDFNTRDRKVSILGRGYFEVTHDASKPFYVKTGRMTTTVVGTSFEVNTTDTAVTSVIVKEGKVNVSAGTTLLSSLIHDRAINVNKVSGYFTVHSVNAAAYCNWTKGEIDFRQVSLQEILHTLSPWYDVSFEIRRPGLWNKKFTFYIRRQGLNESMNFLAAAGGFRYTIDHQTVFIQ